MDCGYTAPRDLNAACNLQQAAEEYRRLKTRAEDETEVGAAGPVV
jgi:transposase